MPSIRPPLPLRTAFAAIGIAALAACGAPTLPDGIAVLSGESVTDSISASLSQPLVLEVRDQGGKPAAGITVELRASLGTVAGSERPTAYFAAPGSNDYQSVLAVTTDQTGKVAVRVVLGTVAGTATVQVAAPTLGFTTTATFTVSPGAPVSLGVAPADTMVYVNGSYALRAAVRDRAGNAVTDAALTYTVQNGAASAAGGTVRGVATGRTSITVSSGVFIQSASVTVVPRGVLLAAGPGGVYSFELDGSGFRRVVAHDGARSPRWFPDRQSFVYSVGLSSAYVANLSGSGRKLVPGSPLAAELWAHPSRDGSWVYFGGYSGTEFRGYPHRVKPDGSQLELVPGFTADGFTQAQPSPSPDGTRVVFFREEGSSRDVTLRVLNMTSGAVELSGVPGHSPAWSYGDSIAYLDVRGGETGPIRLMASNGSGNRLVGGSGYAFGIDWSPDNRWIVARNVPSNRLEVVEVATGQRLPLSYSAGLFDPSWQP